MPRLVDLWWADNTNELIRCFASLFRPVLRSFWMSLVRFDRAHMRLECYQCCGEFTQSVSVYIHPSVLHIRIAICEPFFRSLCICLIANMNWEIPTKTYLFVFVSRTHKCSDSVLLTAYRSGYLLRVNIIGARRPSAVTVTIADFFRNLFMPPIDDNW